MNEFIDIFHSLIRQIPLLRYLHYVNVIAGPNMITVHMQLESSSDQSHINLLPLDAWIYIHVAYTLKFQRFRLTAWFDRIIGWNEVITHDHE